MKTFDPTHIVVVDNGWVFAANLPDGYTPGQPMQLNNARVIIQWGTSDGLGQLCVSGPTKSTKLGEVAVAHIPASRVVFVLEVHSGPWKL